MAGDASASSIKTSSFRKRGILVNKNPRSLVSVENPSQKAFNEKALGQLSQAYQFKGMIGQGGMGAIYRAHDALLKSDVAIKILHQVNELTVQRFQREAQAVINLHHENIVAVRQFGVTDDGQPFMVMEFIEGRTLAAVLSERGALPLELCVNIFKQVCNGISHAHARGVLHRDLKPSNVMLTNPDSWTPLVRIVDFGIAKVLDQDDSTGKLTRTGDFVGSPLYMSPEQCFGKSVDLRTDIYSIGCIMYEALTGRPPHSGETSMEIMLKQMNDKAPTLKEGAGGQSFPVWIERLVAKALAKDPADRFQSIDELKQALEKRVVSETKQAAGTQPASKRIGLIVGVSVVSIAVAASALFLVRGEKNSPKAGSGKMPSQVLAEQFPSLKLGEKKVSDYHDLSNDPSVILAPSADDIVRRIVADRSQTTITNNHKAIHDSALADLKDRIDVKALDLSGSKISNAALKGCAHLPLVRVDLDGCSKITDRVLDEIKPDFLEELSLNKTGFRASGISRLSKYVKLRVLNLGKDEIGNSSLDSIGKLKDLSELDLSYNPISDSVFPVASRLPNLQRLNLYATKITGKDAHLLTNLKHLTRLDVSDTKFTDVALEQIQTLPLMEFEAFNSAITDSAIKSIAKLKDLRQVGLQNVVLSHDSVKKLASLPLNRLILYQCNLDDSDLKTLAQCKTLKELHISGNPKITVEGVRSLTSLPLRELSLVHNAIANKDLPVFYNWKSLKMLDLTNCKVDKAGIESLRPELNSDCSIMPLDQPELKKINFGSPI